MELHFNILDDLSIDLGRGDYFAFLGVNELTYELKEAVREVEYYYTVFMCSWEKPINYARILLDRAINTIKWLFNNKMDVFNRFNLYFACLNSNLEVVQFLYNKGIRDDHYLVSRNLDIIKWLHDNDIRIDIYETFALASREGNLEILKWLHEMKLDRDYESHYVRSLSGAIYRCDINLANWICDNALLGEAKLIIRRHECTYMHYIQEYGEKMFHHRNQTKINQEMIDWLFYRGYTSHLPM